MKKPDSSNLGVKSPYAQIIINPNGIPGGGLKSVVSGGLGQLVVWIFNNKTQDDVVVCLGDWVTNKATNPIPYPYPVVSWLPPADVVTGELVVPAKSTAALIGLVVVNTQAPLLLSGYLKVTTNNGTKTYDPDLEVSPPGTIIIGGKVYPTGAKGKSR